MTRPPLGPPAAVRVDRHWLEHHIPHRDRMCLLEEVLGWDMTQIRCRAASHRQADNPLRARGCLPAACGIEYAGQAMAAHGVLMAGLLGVPARAGYLASVRHLDLHVTRLDDLAEDLTISAQRVAGDDNTVLYAFSITCAERELLTGRASIVFGTLDRAGPA